MQHDGERWLEEIRWLRALARRLVSDPDFADDLVQETAFLSLARSRPPDPEERPWRVGVLKKLIFNSSRESRRRARREARVASPEAIQPYEQLAEQVEIHKRLIESILALDEPLGRTLILRYFHDLSSAEIARRSGEPEPTVRSRLRRALERLREELDRNSGGDRRKWAVPLITWLGLTVGGAGSASALEAGPFATASTESLPPVSSSAAILGGALLSAKKIVTVGALLLLMLAGGLRITRKDSAEQPSRTRGTSLLEEGSRIAAREEGVPVDDSPVDRAIVQIMGSVLDRHSAESISGAEVRLRVDGSVVATTRTDASGRWTLDRQNRAPTGSAKIEVRSATHLPANFFLARTTYPWSAPIPPFFLIEGTPVVVEVRDEDGEPARAAEVTAWGHVTTHDNHAANGSLVRWGASIPDTQYTDQSGRVELLICCGEAYLLARVSSSFGSALVSIPEDLGRTVVIQLSAGDRIRGRVVDESGAPILGARVSATGEIPAPDGIPFDGGARPFHVESDASGRFAIPTPGVAQDLEIDHPDFLFWWNRKADNTALSLGREHEIVLTRARRLLGSVQFPAGAPDFSGPLLASLAIGRATVLGRLERDGSLEIHRVDPQSSGGELRIPGFAPVQLVWPGGSREHDLGRIELQLGTTLAVRVVDTGGTPIPGAGVRATNPETSGWTTPDPVAYTDDVGIARLTGLAPASTRLVAWAPGLATSELAVTVTDGSDESGDEFAITLQRPAELQGRVVDPSGVPLVGCTLKLELADVQLGTYLQNLLPPDVPRTILEECTGEDGLFRFPHVPPVVALQLLATPEKALPDSVAIDALASGEVRDLGSLVLGSGCTIFVRVTDRFGSVVAGASVEISKSPRPGVLHPQGDRVSAPTADDGGLRFTGLPEGEYTIVVRAEERRVAREVIDLHCDGITEETRAEVMLEPAEAWELQVADGDGVPIEGVRIQTSNQTQWERAEATTNVDGRARVSPLPSLPLYYTIDKADSVRFSDYVSTYTDLPARHVLSRGASLQIRYVRPEGGPPFDEVQHRLDGGISGPIVGYGRGEGVLVGGLGPGKYWVDVLCEGYTTFSETVECRVGEVAEIVYAPEVAPELVVLLVDSKGLPVFDGSLSIHSMVGAGVGSRGFREDFPGVYRVQIDRPEAWVAVLAQAEGFVPEQRGDVDPTMSPLRIELRPGTTLDLNVLDSDGGPAKGVEAQLYPRGGTPNWFTGDSRGLAPSDAEGRIEISGLASGLYSLVLSRSGERLCYREVTIPASPRYRFSVDLPRSIEIHGVVLRNGAPIASARVQIRADGETLTQTGPDGAFRAVIGARERVQFTVHLGLAKVSFPDVTVDPEDEIRLEFATVPVEFRFVDESVRPVGPFQVDLGREGPVGGTWSLWVGSDGSTDLLDMIPGRYEFHHAGLPPQHAIASGSIDIHGGLIEVPVVAADLLTVYAAPGTFPIEAMLVDSDGTWRRLDRPSHEAVECAFPIPRSGAPSTVILYALGKASQALEIPAGGFGQPIEFEGKPGGLLFVPPFPGGSLAGVRVTIEPLESTLPDVLRHQALGQGSVFFAIPPGRYLVRVEGPDGPLAEAEARVEIGQRTTIEW